MCSLVMIPSHVTFNTYNNWGELEQAPLLLVEHVTYAMLTEIS